MDILITYDIADTESTGASRLRRIADVCEKYGQRVQFSVFECRLSKARLARLVGAVEGIIDRDRDTVLLYRFPRWYRSCNATFGSASGARSVQAVGPVREIANLR